MTRPVLVSHPTGNANVRQLVRALHEAGQPVEFHTAVNFSGLARSRLVPRRVRGGLERRVFSDADIETHPGWELRLRAPARLPGCGLHAAYRAADATTARALGPRHLAVVVPEDAAARTLRRAGELGLLAVYDLPMPHWRLKHELLHEEAERNPEWAPLLGGLEDGSAVLDRKDEELAEADVVLSASPLTTRSIRQAAPEQSVLEIPYGCPPVLGSGDRPPGGPLRVLFVGSLTQRKGISYVFQAVRALRGAADLTLVGRVPAGPGREILTGALGEHRHIESLPHAVILDLMRRSDVLVLPSIVEGFGLVITEALSQGIPVLTTERTGAQLLFGNDAREWIVEAGTADGLVEQLAGLAASRSLLQDAKAVARTTAERHPWSGYRSALAAALEDRLAGRPPR